MVVQVVDVRLSDLAEQIRVGHQDVRTQLERSLRRAISVGALLLKAKPMVEGSWTNWVEEECGVPSQTAAVYMRVAHYEEILPNGVNLSEAASYLKGLPCVDGKGAYRPRQYPEELVLEARRLSKDEGLKNAEIARRLCVAHKTVKYWVHTQRQSDRDKERRRKRNEARMAKRALLREQAAAAAKKQGGSIAEAYSLLRKLQQELDRASEGAPDKETRQLLRRAWSHVNGAEAEISNALGVDYGSWKRVPVSGMGVKRALPERTS